MSASYIQRDPLVLNPTTLQLLSAKTGTLSCQNDFMASSGRSYLDRPLLSATKPSPPPHSQVSLQSPKMSPDSTLSHHLPAHSTASISHFGPNTSPGLCASSCASSGDGFLRSALTSNNIATDNNTGEKHCVGSSTGNSQSSGSLSTKLDGGVSSARDPTALSPTMMMRPRALTTSNLSRSITPTNTNNTPVSSATCASTPSSTTPVKKSSRRNPWGSETYSDLISIAIHSYPDQQATLQQIYDFIITHYEYFRERSDPTSSAGWKNSIRHNLSLHDRFTKCPKSSDNTKSSYWRINTEVASKPYVRRRACSMDTTNLKRPAGGGHCGKSNGRSSGAGHRTGAHHSQVSALDKLMDSTNAASRSGVMPPLSEVQCPTLTPLLTPSDSMPLRPDSRQTSARNPTGSAFSRAPYLGTSKLPNYFNYAPSNGDLGKSGHDLLSSPYNGISGRWSNPKPSQTPFRSGYPNPTGSYLYDQGVSNFSFEPTNFSSILGSTDQALVRCRASGLIEQLLCSDHPMGAVLSGGKPTTPVVSLTQNAYLPNAFSANRLVQHMATTNGPNRILTDNGSNFPHDPIMAHSPAVDLRPHAALHGNSLISESPNDMRPAHLQHHHLRPVQNCGSGLDAPSSSAFSAASWNSYMPQFHLPSSIGMGYSGFNGSGPFVSQSDLHQLSEAKLKYESTETVISGNGTAQRLLPFLSGPHTTSLSPSTCSSTGSSTTSWRHSLGLDVQTHVEQHRLTSVQPVATGSLTPLSASPCSGQSNMGHENRSIGPPVTPPNPLYYSPIRHSLSDAYGNTECALDTPPYQQHSIKPESLDVLETPSNLAMSTAEVASSVGATDYGSSSRTVAVTSQSTYATNSNPCIVGLRSHSNVDTNSEMNARFADAYSYDDDCEPLELELSLELADRIVGSTRSTDSKT